MPVHEQREHPGEAVDANDEIEPRRRQPRDGFPDHAVLAYFREEEREPGSAGESDQRGAACRGGTCVRRKNGREYASDEGKQKEKEKGHRDSLMPILSSAA